MSIISFVDTILAIPTLNGRKPAAECDRPPRRPSALGYRGSGRMTRNLMCPALLRSGCWTDMMAGIAAPIFRKRVRTFGFGAWRD